MSSEQALAAQRRRIRRAAARRITRWAARCRASASSTRRASTSRRRSSAYDERHPQRSALGSDLGVFAHAWYSHTLWLLGDERRGGGARRDRRWRSRGGSITRTARRSRSRTQRSCTRCAAMPTGCSSARRRRWRSANGTDSPTTAIGPVRSSDGRADSERPAEGIAMIESALERLDAKRAQARRPYYLSLLAETLRPRRKPRSCGVDPRARPSRWRSSAATRWWLPALYLQKSELEPPPEREAMRRRGARAGPRPAQPAAWNGGFSAHSARSSRCAERFRERFANARLHRLSASGGSL